MLGDQAREVDSVDKLHYQKVDSVCLIGIMRDNNIWVVQGCNRFGFATKPLNNLRRLATCRGKDFEANDASHPLVPSLKDVPHATLAHFLQDDIIAKYEP